MSLVWHGETVKRKLASAGAAGVNETMDAAVKHAQANHGGGGGRYTTRSGQLAAGTQVVQEARGDRRGARGRWGVKGPAAAYAARIEFGFQGKDSLGRVVDSPELPFLRPAADATYPGLARRVRKAGPFA